MTYGGYPTHDGVKKILVVKLRQLGDVLLTGPVFSCLKKRFPEADIDAYVYTEAFPLLDGHPAIHQLIGYERGWKNLGLFARLQKEWALFKQIRRNGYDWVINLTEGDRGAIAAKISGAKMRVGFEPKGKWQKKLYTHLVKHCPTPRHTVERNLDVLRRVGLFPEMGQRELFLAVDETSKKKMGSFIQPPFTLIHPTSRWRFKCWPALQMRQLAEALLRQGRQLVFTSGPDPLEREMIQQIASGLNALDLSGQVSLKELVALVQMSDLLICVDSLVFHIANALKKPVVALFGPTSDQTWGPWRNPFAKVIAQNWSCRPCHLDGCGGSKMSDCLATLSVDKVLATIENLPLNRCCAPADHQSALGPRPKGALFPLG